MSLFTTVISKVLIPLFRMWLHDVLRTFSLWLYRPHAGSGRGKEVLRIRLADQVSWYSTVIWPWDIPQLILGQWQGQTYKINNGEFPWGKGPVLQLFWHRPYSTVTGEALPKVSYFRRDERGIMALLFGYGITVERCGR